MVLGDWLVWVQIVTTAVLHLHIPGWCFSGHIIAYAGALCLRGLLIASVWFWLVMACLCLSFLF
jgi:hypothetical protein